MKSCSKCGEEKSLEDFSISKRAKDGREGRCKVCLNNKRKLYYKENKQAFRDYEKTYRDNHKEAVKARGKRCYCKDRTKAQTALYRARKISATPKWSNIKAIRDFYKKCPDGYHVDHIVPLRGKNVRGLHVLANLQYLSAYDNTSKGNRHESDS